MSREHGEESRSSTAEQGRLRGSVSLSEQEVAVVACFREGYGTTAVSRDEGLELLNQLQEALDSARHGPDNLTLNCSLRDFRRRGMRLMMKLSKAFDALPRAIFIDGIHCPHPLDPTYNGGYADIFEGVHRSRTVALKRLRTFMRDSERNAVNRMVGREAALWRQLDHPNVLPFLGVDETTFSPHYALVSPWMKNGNLVDYVARVKLSSGDVNLLLVQTSDGLSYLHSQEIVHGDLRAANILITDAGQACLSDFGLTRVAPTATLTATTTLGRASTRWTAPELLKEEVDAPDPPSDVYSFGYVCLEAYTLKPPFWDVRSEAVVLNKILQGHVVRRPTKDECSGKELSDELWSLMTGCWSSDPSRRPSARRSGSMIRDTLVRERHWQYHQESNEEIESKSESEYSHSPLSSTGASMGKRRDFQVSEPTRPRGRLRTSRWVTHQEDELSFYTNPFVAVSRSDSGISEQVQEGVNVSVPAGEERNIRAWKRDSLRKWVDGQEQFVKSYSNPFVPDPVSENLGPRRESAMVIRSEPVVIQPSPPQSSTDSSPTPDSSLDGREAPIIVVPPPGAQRTTSRPTSAPRLHVGSEHRQRIIVVPPPGAQRTTSRPTSAPRLHVGSEPRQRRKSNEEGPVIPPLPVDLIALPGFEPEIPTWHFQNGLRSDAPLPLSLGGHRAEIIVIPPPGPVTAMARLATDMLETTTYPSYPNEVAEYVIPSETSLKPPSRRAESPQPIVVVPPPLIRNATSSRPTTTRKGFWNRRGDHLTADDKVVYAPHGQLYPNDLQFYPTEYEGFRDEQGNFISLPQPPYG